MTIKQVCERFGLTSDTLRYYVRIGVIPDVNRTAGGVRNYDHRPFGSARAVAWRDSVSFSGLAVDRSPSYVLYCVPAARVGRATEE